MLKRLILPVVALTLTACTSYPSIQTVSHVDLDRFMGKWYVIASIPTSLEQGAHNAVESYRLNPDGTIATTFSFREGSFDGKKKVYHPTGYVEDKTSNAIWGMQFFWPIKADYRIVYLNTGYSETIIGRIKRDYVWIMARTPSITDAQYRKLLQIIKDQGYDVSKVKKVPQHWE